MTVTVEIPMALPSAGNLHEHWRKRHQRIKAQRNATALVLKLTRPESHWPLETRAPMSLAEWVPLGLRLAVTLTRVSPRKLDDDNLAFAFKGVRDEVAAYFGVNDNDSRVTWRYAQERGKAAVRIRFDVEAA